VPGVTARCVRSVGCGVRWGSRSVLLGASGVTAWCVMCRDGLLESSPVGSGVDVPGVPESDVLESMGGRRG